MYLLSYKNKNGPNCSGKCRPKGHHDNNNIRGDVGCETHNGSVELGVY